jgi:hypothetical protein
MEVGERVLPAAFAHFQNSHSWKIAVNLPAMEAAHKGDCTLLENQTNSIIAESNAEIFPLCFEALEVGNLMEISGGFDLLDHFLDSSQETRIRDRGQILFERFAKKGVHAAGWSRRKTFLRVTIGDFSPSWMARMMAMSSRLSRRASRSKSSAISQGDLDLWFEQTSDF